MSPTSRRVLQALLYEAIAIAVVGPVLSLAFDKSPASTFGLAVVLSCIALSWNYVFNWLFERWESRQSVRGRSFARRLAHGAGFLGRLGDPAFAHHVTVAGHFADRCLGGQLGPAGVLFLLRHRIHLVLRPGLRVARLGPGGPCRSGLIQRAVVCMTQSDLKAPTYEERTANPRACLT